MFNLNALLIGGFVFIALLMGAVMYGDSKGSKRERNICEWSKQEVINENIQIRNEQDGVIRPDDAALINSLRRGSF